MKKPSRLIEKYKAIGKIGTSVEIPWGVARFVAPRSQSLAIRSVSAEVIQIMALLKSVEQRLLGTWNSSAVR